MSSKSKSKTQLQSDVSILLSASFCLLMTFAVLGIASETGKTDPVVETERFDILEYQVDGNTVLDQTVVERAVYPALGPNKSITDVEKARKALEKAYHDAGYTTVLVDIPEQGLDEHGRVLLKLTEGQIERLKVTGSRFHLPSRIQDKVPELAEGRVPHMPTVQKQLAALGEESSDRSVTPVLRAGQTPGKLEVELKVDDKLPLHGSVEINSRNSASTSRTRLVGSIRYDNLWQLHHSASLQYQVSPENYDEVEVWSGTYAMPTGLWDTRLAFYGVGISSNTNIASAGALSVVGTGEIYGLRLIKALGSVDDIFHTFTAGFDYKDFGQSVQLTGSDTQNSPVSYASFMLGYTLVYRGEERLSSLDLGLHFAVRGLGNDAQEFADRRYKAKPDYMYLTGEFKHQEILPYDLRMVFRLNGQISAAPLISNEQFSAGGVTSVRGYHQTEALGDHGLSGSLELFSPTLVEHEDIQELRALGFVDGAQLWIRDTLPSEKTSSQLASAGAGLRMRFFRHFISELDWAYPLLAINRVERGEQRVDFRVVYDF